MISSYTEQRQTALRQRTIEMFGLPGDLCTDPACRRRGRCLSAAPQAPDCLRLLDAAGQTFYRRVLRTCQWADDAPLHFLSHYIGAIDDPYLALVGEIVRRAQPRGHWLHASLPWWYRLSRKSGRRPVSLQAAAAFPARCY
ncbi:hypothetical protein [Pararhizobium sp. DWP1-1-3]|uniref:hypothetical protein n=1 Tax=Pararhizobium sp. DWP1-1-3 TaxID=2804652 RepID=UPI003CF52DAF